MKTFLLIIQTLVSVGLVALILLQSSKGGLGTAFGSGEMYRTKRGAEKVVFIMTIVMASLFFIVSVANLLVR